MVSRRPDPFDELFRHLDDLFRQTDLHISPERFHMPIEELRVNDSIHLSTDETEDAYHLIADLPGFETDEITLTFSKGTLTIQAETDTDDDTTRRERAVATTRYIGTDVAVDEIDASYHNGVLDVTLPKDTDGDSHTIDIE